MKTLSELEQRVYDELQKRLKQNENKVQETLAQALTSMRGEMSKLYEKYATNGILTRAEMTKYNKYITMEKQMLAIIDPAITDTIKDIRRLSPQMYNESFFEYAWAMDNGNGVRLSYGNINPDTVMELFSITNPKNIEIIEALKKYKADAPRLIRSALLNGLSQGKSYSKMMRDIQKALNMIAYKALRIVRTEGQRAINTAQYDLYLTAKNKGIEGNEVWDAALDNRTRDSHRDADGQVKGEKGVKGKFVINGWPALYPLDRDLPAEESINCRCRTRFEVDGYAPQLRRTRDQGVIPYQTYDEWKKNYGPTTSRPKRKTSSSLEKIIGAFNAEDLNSE